jgi:hypothetical protein
MILSHLFNLVVTTMEKTLVVKIGREGLYSLGPTKNAKVACN